MATERTIFITGATGFLGAYSLRALLGRKGIRVRALRQARSSDLLVRELPDQPEWIEGDLLDPYVLSDALSGVDSILHCAGRVSFSGRNDKHLMRVNEEGTANVVNAALAEGVKRLVHVSSVAAIGRSKKEQTINEETSWTRSDYNTRYGISKYLGEMQAWRGLAEGLEVAVVNPTNILGSGIWGQGTTQYFLRVARGFPFYPTGGNGFVDVRDVAEFATGLLFSEVSGERYILNTANLTYRELLTAIADELDKQAPRLPFGNFLRTTVPLLGQAVSLLTGKTPVITREIAGQMSRTYRYENDKSLRALPDFRYLPIEKTIRETARDLSRDLEAGRPASLLGLKTN